MNLLDRHIFKSVFYTCAAAVGLFTFVVALANFVRELLGPLLSGQLSVPMLLRLLALLLPYAITYALPMGMLTGVLLTLGRLSADSEVTAMRAAGMGLLRIARPVFILAVLGTAGALYVNFESMPWARSQYYREFADAMRQDPLKFIVPKTFIRDFRGVVVYVGERGTDPKDLRDLWIWQLDNQGRVVRLVRAEAGRLDYDEETNSLVPTLYRAKTEERDREAPEDFGKSPRAPSFQEMKDIRLSLGSYLGRRQARMKPQWLTLEGLQAERQRVSAESPAPEALLEHRRTRMKLDMILQDKVNKALAVFTFAFIAVPLGIKVSRRETSANLGVAVVVVLGYYIFVTMVEALDKRPELRPDLLLWLPNLVLLAIGVWLLRRVERVA